MRAALLRVRPAFLFHLDPSRPSAVDQILLDMCAGAPTPTCYRAQLDHEGTPRLAPPCIGPRSSTRDHAGHVRVERLPYPHEDEGSGRWAGAALLSPPLDHVGDQLADLLHGAERALGNLAPVVARDARHVRPLAGQGSCDGHHLQVPQPARLPGREGDWRGQVCGVHGQAAQGFAAGLDAEELGLPADRLPLRLLRAAAHSSPGGRQ
eukprot:scaffold50384_cov48-Phaeocystis_antarctica.AAC.1